MHVVRAALAALLSVSVAVISPRARAQAVTSIASGSSGGPSAAEPSRSSDPVQGGSGPAPSTKRLLTAGGATLFALSYLASALAATTAYEGDASQTSSRGLLWIPAAGPFMMLGSATAAGGALAVLDGLAQLGGLTMFAWGLATPSSASSPADHETRPAVSIAPVVIAGASGAMLTARF